MTTGHRTVADIIAGHMSGVFGTVAHVSETGPSGEGKYPLVAVTLHNPVGLTLCDCGSGYVHAEAVFAGLNCGPGDPENTYALMRKYLAAGGNVELVGDVVRMLGGFPVISGFVYYDGAPRGMTVPDRTRLEVNEHCQICPLETPPIGLRQARRAAERQARKRQP